MVQSHIEINLLSDNQIVQICKSKPEAFGELVKRYQEKLIWASYQMLGNWEEARDVSQEAFIRTYKALNQFNPESNFYTWLYRIAINLCIDHLRKNKHGNRLVSLDNTEEAKSCDLPADEQLEKKEVSQEVNKILQEIPEQYRVILILRDIEGFSCKEIEKILDCNYNTIRWRLFRARQVFKDAWEKHQKKEF